MGCALRRHRSSPIFSERNVCLDRGWLKIVAFGDFVMWIYAALCLLSRVMMLWTTTGWNPRKCTFFRFTVDSSVRCNYTAPRLPLTTFAVLVFSPANLPIYYASRPTISLSSYPSCSSITTRPSSPCGSALPVSKPILPPTSVII